MYLINVFCLFQQAFSLSRISTAPISNAPLSRLALVKIHPWRMVSQLITSQVAPHGPVRPPAATDGGSSETASIGRCERSAAIFARARREMAAPSRICQPGAVLFLPEPETPQSRSEWERAEGVGNNRENDPPIMDSGSPRYGVLRKRCHFSPTNIQHSPCLSSEIRERINPIATTASHPSGMGVILILIPGLSL